jgi:hypothetical protein
MSGFDLRQGRAPSTPDKLRARMEAENKLWADVIKAADIRIN